MAELISVEGEALTTGFINEPNTFKVSMSGMNTSKLVVAFQGPTKPQVKLANQKDGNVECTYITPQEGDYTLNITFDDDHVEGSPFKMTIKPK